MADVIVERSFAEPVDFSAIQAIEDRGAWCLDQHNVRFVRTWFSKDRRRMVCLYEAPDAESVRIAQKKAGMPVDRVWAVAGDPVPGGPRRPGAEAGVHVAVERTFGEPVSLEEITALIAKGGECLPRHRAAYLGGHLSSDGLRMFCVFFAPDAESVRIANREFGAPFDRAWTATVHEPPGQE